MKSTNVFVKTDATLEGFVRDLETTTDAKFELREDEGEGPVYWAAIDDADVLVAANAYETDGELRYGDYRFDIDVSMRDGARRQAVARGIFDGLAKTRRYPLMLVEDLQALVAELSP